MHKPNSFLYVGLAAFLLLSGCSASRKSIVEDTSIVDAVIDANDSVKEPAIYRGSDPISHNLIHTKLQVSFDWSKSQLNGTAEITLKPHFYPQKMLFLDARGMEVKGVKLVLSGSKQDLVYEYRNDSICITM
ncbi:MAG: hypothetical protein ACKPAD_13445, partial [Bacteroidota bacterium]